MRTLAIILALAGCAESIRPDRPDGGPTVDATFIGPFGTVTNPDGTFTTRVDASSTEAWLYGDFETTAAVTEADAWDLRFQRFHISTNGGISGTGGVEVIALTGVPFEALFTPPASGYVSDAPDGDDANMEPDYAFEQGEGWYAYDQETHVLTPRPLVWVVKTAGGSTIKLELLGYYDDAGTAGFLTFRWAPL
jgi:hypothetical protein